MAGGLFLIAALNPPMLEAVFIWSKGDRVIIPILKQQQQQDVSGMLKFLCQFHWKTQSASFYLTDKSHF